MRNALLSVAMMGSLLAMPATADAKTLTPRHSLIRAHGRIHAVARKASATTSEKSASAAAHELTLATNPELWISGNEVAAPSYGTRVFTDSGRALRDLKRLPAKKTAGAARLIVGADRGVANYMIGQAQGGDSALLAAAAGDVKSGDAKAGKGQRRAAVRDYARAWEDAYQALTGLIVAKVTSVPAADLGAAAENAIGSPEIGLAGPTILSGQQPLTADGKPEVFFGGSEACPFCGVERWGLIVALAQFGKFSNLHLMQSLPTEQPADRTFTFFGSSYQSPYISFVPVEVWSNERKHFAFKPLQPLTPAETALFKQFDPSRTTPFIDVANAYTNVDSTVDPQLIGGLSWSQDADSLTQPSSLPAQAIGGEAEVLTAEICEATHGNPSSVCSGQIVMQYEAGLPYFNGQGGGCPPPARDARQRRSGPVATAAKCGG